MIAVPTRKRKIPLWKLVGGAAVHFVVPAYAVALGVDGWRFAMAGGGDLAAWLAHVPGASGWFLGIYGVLGLGATGLAALAGPGQAAAPALDGAEHLRAALARGRGMFGPRGDAALERIAALRLDGTDAQLAPMLRDLAAMVAAGCEAMAGGEDEGLSAMTAGAIERIAGELEALAGAGAQEARDKVRVMATYVGHRYGQDEIQDILK
jgi:hypothetical protein